MFVTLAEPSNVVVVEVLERPTASSLPVLSLPAEVAVAALPEMLAEMVFVDGVSVTAES